MYGLSGRGHYKWISLLPVTFPLYTFYDLQCELWQLRLGSRSADFSSESSMLCTRQCMHVHKIPSGMANSVITVER